jgi:predicted unusual protein kinase regulating ubiquinone biosynthesis (AarF/ABC1/UbiB family)
VPAGRIERLARFGWLAGEVALGAVAEGVRRIAGSPAAHSLMLTEANAQRLARRLSGLRGAAMKVGQMLSLQGADILPPEVTRALAILRAEADAMPQAQLRRVLGQAFGAGWEARLCDFDAVPVAAASIGQVHRATAADGRQLALKIQYPGVAHSIDSDIQNVAAILRLTHVLPRDVDFSELLAEAKRQLRRETDYYIEAGFQRRYRALVADEPDLIVPCVHDDFTTARILAMDFIDGVLLETLGQDAYPQGLRDHIGMLLYRLVLRELFEFRFVQSDPNFANYLFLPATGQVALLDFGGSRDIPPRFAQGYARAFAAAADSDRAVLQEALQEIGFLRAETSGEVRNTFIDLFLFGCEPFRHRGAYDFAASKLPVRVRDVGLELAFRTGGFRLPPPDAVFVNRKLVGTFLLCARLRARVDVRALLRAALDRAAAVT